MTTSDLGTLEQYNTTTGATIDSPPIISSLTITGATGGAAGGDTV